MNADPRETATRVLRDTLSNQKSRDLVEVEELRASWRRGEQLLKIGAGACGEVYQMTGSGGDMVAKRAKTEEHVYPPYVWDAGWLQDLWVRESGAATGSSVAALLGVAVSGIILTVRWLKRQILGCSGYCADLMRRYARQLADDYKWHLRIHDALSRRAEALELDICLPRPQELVASSSDSEEAASWWRDHGISFPSDSQTLPEVVLVSERMVPVPVNARHGLIALYCPESRRDAAKRDPANVDCLIRVYLGKRRPERRATSMVSMFGLRNFQMYADDFEKVGLAREMEGYAVSMARTLALLHWEVRCDGNDVEFVLGGARENAADREVDIWLIDFNRVRAITMDAEGIKLATEAFMVNDRYYPRPRSGTAAGEMLWSTFKMAYLETSWRLQRLQEATGQAADWEDLPEAFIEAVAQAQSTLLQEKTEAMGRASWTDRTDGT